MEHQPVDRVERARTILADPEVLNTICAHVANGGTLVTLCETWDVRYSDILAWIYQRDPQTQKHTYRKDVYERSLADRVEWEIESLLRELRRIGTVDIRRAYDKNNNLLPIQDIPPEVAAAIVGIESLQKFEMQDGERVYIGDTVKVKFSDKLKAIELLGKKLAMFVDKHIIDVGEKLEDVIMRSYQVAPPALSAPDPALPAPPASTPAEAAHESSNQGAQA